MKKAFAFAATLAILFAVIALPASASAACSGSNHGGSYQGWNNHRGFDRDRNHNQMNPMMRFLMMRSLMQQNGNCSNGNCGQNGCSNCANCANGCSNCADCGSNGCSSCGR